MCAIIKKWRNDDVLAVVVGFATLTIIVCGVMIGCGVHYDNSYNRQEQLNVHMSNGKSDCTRFACFVTFDYNYTFADTIYTGIGSAEFNGQGAPVDAEKFSRYIESLFWIDPLDPNEIYYNRGSNLYGWVIALWLIGGIALFPLLLMDIVLCCNLNA